MHNLLRLYEKTDLELNEKQKDFIAEFDRYQIESRYPEFWQAKIEKESADNEFKEAKYIKKMDIFFSRHKQGGLGMETRTISLELPVGVFSALRKTPEELEKDIRVVAAVKWYEMGQISQEKASEIAGLCREDFLLALSNFNVSPFQYTASEVLEEAGYE